MIMVARNDQKSRANGARAKSRVNMVARYAVCARTRAIVAQYMLTATICHKSVTIIVTTIA